MGPLNTPGFATQVAVMLIQLYLLVTVLDVLLAWVQPDTTRMPRRLFHAATEPVQRPMRALLRAVPQGDWDASPLLVVLLLGAVRVWLLLP